MSDFSAKTPFTFNAEQGLVLLIDKELTWTSFDAVNKMKYILFGYLRKQIEAGKLELLPKQKLRIKIGHAGTLDPLATGLLIVCMGKQTKNINAYMGMEKEYTGSFFIGAQTPSFDLETEVSNIFSTSHITPDLIYQTAQQFVGEQLQFPPVFSAIKKDGKRLYEMARAGEEVELTARKVVVHSFEITKIEMPLVYFKITCAKGTYIRSIANDFGKALNSGAYLNTLRRTKIGNYTVNDALTMDTFKQWVLTEQPTTDN